MVTLVSEARYRIRLAEREHSMFDVILIAVGCGCFAVAIAYAYACDRL